MSDTEMSKELTIATKTFDLSLMDLERVAVSAAKSSFTPYNDRVNLIHRESSHPTRFYSLSWKQRL